MAPLATQIHVPNNQLTGLGWWIQTTIPAVKLSRLRDPFTDSEDRSSESRRAVLA